jgi:Flp pilus assembly protein TadD
MVIGVARLESRETISNRLRTRLSRLPSSSFVSARLPLLAALLALFVGGGSALAQSTAAPRAAPPAPSEAEQVTQLMRDKQPQAALDRVDGFLEKRPRDAQLRFLRGVILSDLGRGTDAVGVFEQLIRDFPELPEPYNNLAVLVASQGRYEHARGLLHQAITAQPNYVTAYENLGDLHVAMAIDAYQQASKLLPNDAGLQGKLKLARDFGSQVRAPR